MISQKAVQDYIEYEKDKLRIMAVLPRDQWPAALHSAAGMSSAQRKGFARLLAMGDHHESAASLILRCPDDLIDMAINEIALSNVRRMASVFTATAPKH